MSYTSDLVHEMNTLLRFDLATDQQGIKIHTSADIAVIGATQRLFAKGLITQESDQYQYRFPR